MSQFIRSALVQIMACRLFVANPLSKPMLGYRQVGTNLSEVLIWIQTFSFREMHLNMSAANLAAILSGPPNVLMTWAPLQYKDDVLPVKENPLWR